MESTEQQGTDANSPKNLRTLIIVVAIVILCVPIGFLLLKKGKTDAPAATATPAPNIAALEALVASKPSYDNLINLAVAYINVKAPGRAVPYLKQALKIDSTKALAYNNLGVAYIMLRNYKAGITNCEKATQLDPKFQLAKNNLKWGVDELNKTITDINKLEATPVDKRQLSTFIDLGLDYQYISANDKALQTIQQGLQHYPNNTVLLNNAGTVLVLDKKYDAAIAEFNQVLKAEPTNQLAKNNIAWALQEKTGGK